MDDKQIERLRMLAAMSSPALSALVDIALSRITELAARCDKLSREKLKANPKWVELRMLESGAVCDGSCAGAAGQSCGTCKADVGWKSRVAELKGELTKGRRLVHASAVTERVSPRLVAWAGEPEQSGDKKD